MSNLIIINKEKIVKRVKSFDEFLNYVKEITGLDTDNTKNKYLRIDDKKIYLCEKNNSILSYIMTTENIIDEWSLTDYNSFFGIDENDVFESITPTKSFSSTLIIGMDINEKIIDSIKITRELSESYNINSDKIHVFERNEKYIKKWTDEMPNVNIIKNLSPNTTKGSILEIMRNQINNENVSILCLHIGTWEIDNIIQNILFNHKHYRMCLVVMLYDQFNMIASYRSIFDNLIIHNINDQKYINLVREKYYNLTDEELNKERIVIRR